MFILFVNQGNALSEAIKIYLLGNVNAIPFVSFP